MTAYFTAAKNHEKQLMRKGGPSRRGKVTGYQNGNLRRPGLPVWGSVTTSSTSFISTPDMPKPSATNSVWLLQVNASQCLGGNFLFRLANRSSLCRDCPCGVSGVCGEAKQRSALVSPSWS
jgi:hypothetical protein